MSVMSINVPMKPLGYTHSLQQGDWLILSYGTKDLRASGSARNMLGVISLPIYKQEKTITR